MPAASSLSWFGRMASGTGRLARRLFTFALAVGPRRHPVRDVAVARPAPTLAAL